MPHKRSPARVLGKAKGAERPANVARAFKKAYGRSLKISAPGARMRVFWQVFPCLFFAAHRHMRVAHMRAAKRAIKIYAATGIIDIYADEFLNASKQESELSKIKVLSQPEMF
ncbi:MAG: hypothetical protein DBX55_02115 [Verrucomicrobia bacterium]|nr:MAG: hypothetical protein DBX55_02115 [Verrucomicrobiota bacterium]